MSHLKMSNWVLSSIRAQDQSRRQSNDKEPIAPVFVDVVRGDLLAPDHEPEPKHSS